MSVGLTWFNSPPVVGGVVVDVVKVLEEVLVVMLVSVVMVVVVDLCRWVFVRFRNHLS